MSYLKIHSPRAYLSRDRSLDCSASIKDHLFDERAQMKTKHEKLWSVVNNWKQRPENIPSDSSAPPKPRFILHKYKNDRISAELKEEILNDKAKQEYAERALVQCEDMIIQQREANSKILEELNELTLRHKAQSKKLEEEKKKNRQLEATIRLAKAKTDKKREKLEYVLQLEANQRFDTLNRKLKNHHNEYLKIQLINKKQQIRIRKLEKENRFLLEQVRTKLPQRSIKPFIHSLN